MQDTGEYPLSFDVRNVTAVRESMAGGPALIHLTPEQWDIARKDVKQTDELPESDPSDASWAGVLSAGFLPGEGRGRVVRIERCPKGEL